MSGNYDQGGAHLLGNVQGNTKKALKEALRDEPDKVHLYTTSVMGGPSFRGKATDLPEGLTFNVVGPDPYHKRNWYASVRKAGDRVTCT